MSQTHTVIPVFFVRHAQTQWNAERRFQGQRDIPLDTEGRRQAHTVAAWIARQPFDFRAVYSSDLARARDTALAIGRHFGLTPIVSPALREIETGDWTGLDRDEIETRFPGQLDAWHNDVERTAPPNGESMPQVVARMRDHYQTILETHRGGGIIIVSHGTALRGLVTDLLGWPLSETWRTQRIRFGNTAVAHLRYDTTTGQHSLVYLNRTDHLHIR